jgi:hypothetical protein
MVIKRFDPLSCAKISGILYAVFGLVFGAIFSLISLLHGFASAKPGAAAPAAVLGVGAIVILPLLYGGLAFVGALIGALLYNGAARFVGGIKIDVE